ncbi:uncharacterized protein LOC109715182 isoform X2 [Ananas comosus]|uniref:Uncharacterized protein LOC109715182 isoform X2 n=1 Tax=Ananas comosus TaxID=4615 RepID=A0A6P5FQ67_ANACO|nr:uncharacterized protein LOC109715182 isoform X2 [Ananas comosus]
MFMCEELQHDKICEQRIPVSCKHKHEHVELLLLIITWYRSSPPVELRDVDTGNKTTERFRTDEAIERVFVEEKSFTFLYHEGDSVMLMEPTTFEQLEVPKEMFGKAAAYLKDDMSVTVQYYDGRPMSASVPQRVTCTVVEAQPNTKGLTAAPQYKRVVLDNGLTVLAPPFVEAGDEIVINTTDDSYMTRAKE